MKARLLLGDCRDLMRAMDAESIDAIVSDPPYGLSFMGKGWDHGVPGEDFWIEALRVAKPGAHLLAFGGTRTFHRLAVAIEDAGWEMRDCLMWVYGSGFPKSMNIGGGWGTALKPAWEPIIMARKPLEGTVAANVLKHGTGAMNIDGCRVRLAEGEVVHAPQSDPTNRAGEVGRDLGFTGNDAEAFRQAQRESIERTNTLGRWPANVILTHAPGCRQTGTRPDTFGGGAKATSGFVTGYAHDGFIGQTVDVPVWACEPGCPVAALDAQSGVSQSRVAARGGTSPNPMSWGTARTDGDKIAGHGDTGGASRFFTVTKYGDDDLPGAKPGDPPFFYHAKAARSEREAGCAKLPARTGSEAVGRAEGSAGTQSPRAGAGRTANNVHNHHPTVKPVAVMRWLVKLVTPQGGVVLDPFMGSGTTGVAATLEGFSFVGCELQSEYMAIAEARIQHAEGEVEPLLRVRT